MLTRENDRFLILPDNVNVIPLQEVLEVNQGEVPKKSSDALSKLASGFINEADTNVKRHRFNFKVVRDVNACLQSDANESEKMVVQLGKALLKNTFKGDVKKHVEEMFESAMEVADKYMMVTLFGEYIGSKKEEMCVAALLGIWDSNGLYITHMAVTDQFFSVSKFGRLGDSKSFLHRGIAKLTVAVAQAFLLCIYGRNDIYLFSPYLHVDRGCLWNMLGFERVLNPRIFPDDTIQLINLYSFTNFEELFEDQRLIPYFIRAQVQEYAVFGHLIDTIYEGEECFFFQAPFYHWPSIAEDSWNSCSDIQLAAYCMQGTPGAKKAEETMIPQRNLAKILLDILRNTKARIMEQKQYFEDTKNTELRDLLVEGCILPSIAIDYVNMALMISHGHPHINVYTISTDTVRRLCEDGWPVASDHFQQDFPGVKSEFDLIKEQWESRTARFIIPFLQDSKFWCNIVRVWLHDCIIFLFSDSSDETMDEYERTEDEDGEIPLSVMLPFMNSPLWPLGVKAYWIRVPNIQEVEEESGARCFLHGYMMGIFPGHAAFHCALLKLHDLDEEEDELNTVCRNWVHDIMVRKRFFVPAMIRKITAVKKEVRIPAFPYQRQWFEENSFPHIVHSLNEWQDLEDQLRDEAAAKKAQEQRVHVIEERFRVLKERERGIYSTPLPPRPPLNPRHSGGVSATTSRERGHVAPVAPRATDVAAVLASSKVTDALCAGNSSTLVTTGAAALAPIPASISVTEGNSSAPPVPVTTDAAAAASIPASTNVSDASCEGNISATVAIRATVEAPQPDSINVTNASPPTQSTFNTVGEVTLSQIDSAETNEILLTGSTEGEEIATLPVRISKYYDVFLPKTSEGFMIHVGDLDDPKLKKSLSDIKNYEDVGYHTVFTGYRRHNNGDISYAEQHQLIRNHGDIITALNDNDVLGLCFEDVFSLLGETLPDSNNRVKFRMLDKTLLFPKKPQAVNLSETSQPHSSLRTAAGGKTLFMQASSDEDSGDEAINGGSNDAENVARGKSSVNVETELVNTDDETEQEVASTAPLNNGGSGDVESVARGKSSVNVETELVNTDDETEQEVASTAPLNNGGSGDAENVARGKSSSVNVETELVNTDDEIEQEVASATPLNNGGSGDAENVARGKSSVNVETELVNTDDEIEQEVECLGISHHLQRLQLDLADDDAVTCDACKSRRRGRYLFVGLDDNLMVAKYCIRCSKDKRPFAKSMLDNKLSKTFGKKPQNTYGIDNLVAFNSDETRWEHQINEFNSRLATIDEIKFCVLLKGRSFYKGRPKDDEENEFIIDEYLMRDTLFEFFPKELTRIKLGRNEWHELSPEVKEYIWLHGICYSNDQIYYCLYETESEEWQYIKYNTWNRLGISPGDNYKIVDTEEQKSELNTAWISLTNNTKRAEIQMVPCYYLARWELYCEKDKLPGTRSEYINVLLEAQDNANRWVEIPQGSSKSDFFAFEYGNIHHLPKSYRIQRPGENSCVFNSLANALHYINDYHGRDEILDKLEKSLDYSEYRDVAKTRRSFAAHVMNFCVKGYTARLLTNLDILADRTMWPTLCILKGDDNSTNHAVTIVENYIFDSNNSYALPLHKSNLDWCCTGDEGPGVKFVSVPFAYRFNRHNPPPQLVLRHGGRNNNSMAVQAVVRSLQEMNDTEAASLLQQYRSRVTPDENVITAVREMLKTRELQYVPLRLKDINDLLLQTSVNFPTMFLIHLKGTFHCAIFSSLGNQYFDDTRGGF